MYQRIHHCKIKKVSHTENIQKRVSQKDALFLFKKSTEQTHSFVIFVLMIKRLPHITALILATLWLAAGCENDIERINMLTNDREMPTVNGTNVKVIYSDSGRVKVQILAPTYKQFPNAEKPYMEFPDGMEVFFYNDSMMIESEIRSDYSIYYTSDRLWHATGNVVAHRLTNGDALNTEELFWDEEKQLIYSNVYTRVQNEDNTLYGKGGFEAQQNLDNWFLKGTSGEIMVSDEE